jgi:hypothetical protein
LHVADLVEQTIRDHYTSDPEIDVNFTIDFEPDFDPDEST